MKHFLFINCLLLISLFSFCQDISSGQSCKIDPAQPNYPGGSEKLSKYIVDNLPDSLKRMGINGRIFISLTIDSSGSIKKAIVIHGINNSVDSAVIKIIRSMPKWIPGQKDGKKLEKSFVFPFKFEIQKQN
jgi:protein TonB